MTFIWNQLSQEATKKEIDLDKYPNICTPKSCVTNKNVIYNFFFFRVSDLILTQTFFWYNFMPLSRGTAAVGYMALLAMFLALDIDISCEIPKDFQPDWEGILTPHVQDFINTLKVWMYPARKPTNILDGIPSVAQTFSTIRGIIEAINAYSI